jgi:hypothetical protein
MTEQELYERVVALRDAADGLVEFAGDMPATIELCVFTGMLGGALKILEALEAAGVPIHDSDEEPHPLEHTS